jgi:hypothetical protein
MRVFYAVIAYLERQRRIATLHPAIKIDNLNRWTHDSPTPENVTNLFADETFVSSFGEQGYSSQSQYRREKQKQKRSRGYGRDQPVR